MRERAAKAHQRRCDLRVAAQARERLISLWGAFSFGWAAAVLEGKRMAYIAMPVAHLPPGRRAS